MLCLWIWTLIIIEHNSAAKRVTFEELHHGADVSTAYFCEIIHEGAEWLEVHSRSAVKGKYACVGAMLLEESGSGRSNYSYSYVFLFYLISNKHAFLNFPSTKKNQKKHHTATTIYPRLWESNFGYH